MKRINIKDKREFYVVQFIEFPCEGIDDNVCVPYTWVRLRRATDQKAVVAYPTDEDPFKTRDRVERKEIYNNKWKYYMAYVKYESDSYSDAQYWIASRNDYGPLVEEELKTIDTEPTFPLNKKSHISNQNQLSKFYDDSRKRLPRISIKRPALLEPNKQYYGKRVKPDNAAQSSSAVVIDANEEPGSSRSQQLIINQNNQPMEPAQTGTTASESLPIQEQQKLSMPSIDVDTPTFVIDDNKEVQPTSAKKQQVSSYQSISQFTKQLEPIREPQIPVAPSIEMTSNNHILNSLKTPAQLYSRWNEARRLIPTEKPVERKIRPINIAVNLVLAEQNPSDLMDQTGSLSTSSVPTQQLYSTQSFQNQCLPTDQINFKQGLLTEPKESSNYNYRPNSQTISTSTPSIGRNSIIHSSPLCQTSKRPQRRQSQPALQDSHQLSQKSKIRIGNSNESKNNRQISALQRVINETLPPILTEVINSLRQQGSPTDREYHLNKYLLQKNHRKRALVNGNHVNVIDDTLQTNEWMVEDTPSAAYCRANSDSDTSTYHEVISDHEMSTDEAAIERTNRFYSTGFTSGSSCADRLIAVQTSTDDQTYSKVFLEQQILNFSDELCSTMKSNLRYTCDMFNSLRGEIFDSALTFKKLLKTVAEFRSMQNLASSGSSSSNLKPEVSEFTQERHIKIPARANSSNVNQYSKNVADNVFLEQQILNFSHELYSNMKSNLRNTCDMLKNLRGKIIDSALTFKKLLKTVAELRSKQNLAGSPSSSSNLKPEVSEFTEERLIKISARANSSNVNQYSKNVADNQSKKKHNNMWRPFIPPEYDPNDSKWTLKYRTYVIGLVELMPQSGIYVSYGDLKYCERVSKDCESLARRLLPAVFNRKALSVCLSMTERARASHNVGYNIRPELDDHACSVLLRFVLDHGSQHDWNIDEENILRILHCTVLDIRFKYGELVRC